MSKKSFFFLVMFLVCSFSVQALVVGSNTVVSREDTPTFPASGTDNTMRGFALFEDGFNLQDNTTTCSFDSVFPISGTANLNGGILYLQKDLVFTNSSLIAGGWFVGNDYSIELPKSLLTNYIPIASSSSITGVNLVDTENMQDLVYSVDWSYDGSYLAGASDSSTESELQVFYFDGNTLTVTAQVEHSTDVFCVRWHPSQRYLAVAKKDSGDIRIYRHNVSNGTFTQTDSEGLSGTARGLAWHPTGNYLVYTRKDNNPEIYLYSFNDTNGTLTQIDTEELSSSRQPQLHAVSFSSDGNYIAIGTEDSSSSHDLFVYEFDPGNPSDELSLNASINTGETVESVEWCPALTDHIAVGLIGGSERFRLYQHNAGGGTLTEVTSGRVGESLPVYQIDWSSDGQYLVYGVEQWDVVRFKIYSFDSSAKTFSLLVDKQITGCDEYKRVYDIRWSPDDDYIALGDTHSLVKVYEILGDENFWSLFLKNIVIQANSPVEVTKPWKFIGSCTLYGEGHKFSFNSADGKFVVAPNTHVILEDVVFEDLENGMIECMHDDSSITLRNCILGFATEFTFSKGYLTFDKDVALTGTIKFNYTSATASTISSDATLYIDHGMTFSYDPSNSNKELIVMEDETAALYLNGSRLHTTHKGFQLSGGKLFFDNKVTLSSEGRNTGEALEFATDLDMHVLGGAGVDVFGFVKYG